MLKKCKFSLSATQLAVVAGPLIIVDYLVWVERREDEFQVPERKWKWKSLSQVPLFVTPWSPWSSPGQNTGVGSLSLLQGIFPTQGSNPGLPHCRWIPYQLSHKGSPRILEWVAYPFSRGSSWPKNLIGISCMQADSLSYQGSPTILNVP